MYMGKKCLGAMVISLSSLHAGGFLSLLYPEGQSKELMEDGFISSTRATTVEELIFLEGHSKNQVYPVKKGAVYISDLCTIAETCDDMSAKAMNEQLGRIERQLLGDIALQFLDQAADEWPCRAVIISELDVTQALDYLHALPQISEAQQVFKKFLCEQQKRLARLPVPVG